MDPWSRRQQPFKVPRLRWHQRYPRTVVLLITFGGSGLLFSRFIYDAFLKRFFEDEPRNRLEIDINLLMSTAKNRKSERKSVMEIAEEQRIFKEEERQRIAELAKRV